MASTDNSENRLLQIIRTQKEIATTDLESESTMQVAVDRALELTGAASALIGMIEGDDLVLKVAAGGAVELRGAHIDRESSLAGLTLREKRILTSDDCAADPRVVPAVGSFNTTGSAICVPLVHRDQAVAVLSVHHPEPDHFGAGDVQTLELLSDVIAAHLSHAALLAEEAHDSRHDALTELPNRRAYEERLNYEVARARRYHHPLALCILDLDGFKLVNDRLGHPAGDRILRAVADAIRATREADEGFRIGGDEFAILMPETTARDAIAGVQRVIDELSRAEVDGLGQIGVSYGIASGETHPEALHAAADRELLAAKAALYGRGSAYPDSLAA